MFFKTAIRAGLARREASVFILVSLTLYGFAWCGLLPGVGGTNEVRAFSLASHGESPLRGGEDYLSQLPLWHVNQSDIAFPQSATAISTNRVPARGSGNIGNASWYCYHNRDFIDAASMRIYDNLNTAFNLADGQPYLRVDIPPPYSVASL